tara:strand:+ start:1086 stop:1274 length:189 start_codon:yes stop_codon:yes gene_type:complete
MLFYFVSINIFEKESCLLSSQKLKRVKGSRKIYIFSKIKMTIGVFFQKLAKFNDKKISSILN